MVRVAQLNSRSEVLNMNKCNYKHHMYNVKVAVLKINLA
jgi:hypothetical protein